MADGEVVSEQVSKLGDADLRSIQLRLEELLTAKRARQAKARVKVTVPADRPDDEVRHAAR